MTQQKSDLDLFYIKSPCAADWNLMRGGNRIRYCGECKKYVYNLSAMPRAQAEALIASSQGNFCARITQHPDGTIVTDEPASQLHQINRRPSPLAAAVVTAIMSLSPVVAAQQPLDSSVTVSSATAGQKKDAQPQDATASIFGKVTDAGNGSAVMGARISLMNESTGITKVTLVREDGSYRFASLKAGNYILKVELQGFDKHEQHGIILKANLARCINVELQPHREIMGLLVASRQPLRTLYENSDRIVVATIADSSKVKTTLNVSSTIKGEGHKPILHIHDKIQDKHDNKIKKGEQILVFLTRLESSSGEKDFYNVVGDDSGVKKLSDTELQAYLKHIEELKKIVDEEKPDQAEIVEWLVQCVEDPTTRWEGAYELSSHANEFRYRQELKESQRTEAEEQNSNSDEAEEKGVVNTEKIKLLAMSNTEEEDRKEDNLITLLTVPQKERLMAVLLNAAEIKAGEFALIEFVQDWNDERLMPHLIAKLHSLELAPNPDAMNLMRKIAELTGDEDLEEQARDFIENASWDDLWTEREEEIKQKLKGKDLKRALEEWAEYKKKTPLEAIQERSAMVKEFLKLVEKKLAKDAQ